MKTLPTPQIPILNPTQHFTAYIKPLSHFMGGKTLHLRNDSRKIISTICFLFYGLQKLNLSYDIDREKIFLKFTFLKRID